MNLFKSIYVSMYVFLYVSMYVRIRINVCMYVHMYVCNMYAYMYLCMYAIVIILNLRVEAGKVNAIFSICQITFSCRSSEWSEHLGKYFLRYTVVLLSSRSTHVLTALFCSYSTRV